jgi:P-type conjugative transfer protein TrbJ
MIRFGTLSHRALRAAAVSVPLFVASAVSEQARCQVVYDPWNYSQNILTAARALEQVNNQITSLQNETQILVNQARNLKSLPQSSLQPILDSIQNTQRLLNQAQRIAYDGQQIDRAFSTTYSTASTNSSDQSLVDGARQRWQNSLAALQDALKVQAGAVANLDSNRSTMSTLVISSQAATGALQTAQAGNQLLALHAQQLGDLTAVVVALGRAQSIDLAERASAQEQGREQLRRFLTPGVGYQPGNARMFQQ